MTKPRQDVIRRALLCEAIVTHITGQRQTLKQLAAHFGVNSSTLAGILASLQNNHRVHQVRIPGSRRYCIEWTAGPMPDDVAFDEIAEDLPKRTTVSSYPLNHRRDPLVAAIFGEVRCA